MNLHISTATAFPERQASDNELVADRRRPKADPFRPALIVFARAIGQNPGDVLAAPAVDANGGGIAAPPPPGAPPFPRNRLADFSHGPAPFARCDTVNP